MTTTGSSWTQPPSSSASTPFWEALDWSGREAFRALAQERTFAKGARLIREDDNSDHVMVILSGHTRISVDHDGSNRVIAERGPGELVGERAVLQLNTRSATVVALETVRALVMTTEDFAVFLSSHPTVLGIVEGQVYRRLTEGQVKGGQERFSRMEELRAKDPPQTTDRSGDWPSADRLFRYPLTGQNCTVIRTDVVAFGARYRSDADRRFIRLAIPEMTQTALGGIWGECWCEDRGDGLLIVVSPSIPTTRALENMAMALPATLRKHNHNYGRGRWIQMRVAIDVGPVENDSMGVTGSAIIRTARLLDARPLKKAMIGGRANLGIILSDFVYETAMAQPGDALSPASYERVRVRVKESNMDAWMAIIDPAPQASCLRWLQFIDSMPPLLRRGHLEILRRWKTVQVLWPAHTAPPR